jgi:hypothetical protein
VIVLFPAKYDEIEACENAKCARDIGNYKSHQFRAEELRLQKSSKLNMYFILMMDKSLLVLF